jgi:hypothetical protein
MYQPPQKQYSYYHCNWLPCLMLCILFFVACKPKLPGSAEQVTDHVVMDTIQKRRIDTLITEVNKVILSLGMPNKIPYPVYTIKDTIYYWLSDEYTGRISIELEPPDEVNWPMFFIYKKELIKIRYRHLFLESGIRYAYESNIYFNKGKIIYCDERKRVIADGEHAGLIRQFSFEPSHRSYKEIEGDYLDTWKKILVVLREKDPETKLIKD